MPATPGREGELIFRLIQQYSKVKHPVQRLWLQSMTPQAIRDGFANLRSDKQMLPLADAARCRSEADWLVGINGTRAMTAFNSRDGGFFLTTVGRVQTPTLSVVVEREEKIRKFVSRNYWEIHASFAGRRPASTPASGSTRSGRRPRPTRRPAMATSRRGTAGRPALVAGRGQAIADAVRGKTATVTEESKPTTQASPLLFDLTSLQREANGKFGFSAKTTLSIAQSLYERHKALTYPRTDSRALPEDYLPVVKQTFEMLAGSPMKHLARMRPPRSRATTSSPANASSTTAKVSDHFAIIPTLQPAQGLSEAEQKIYDLVVRRFMAVFFPSAEYQVTTRISVCAGHSFKTEGKVLVKPGWLAIYGKEAQDEVKDGDEKNPAMLVPVQPGEKVGVASVDPKGLQTRPPARYSEATLLGAMEGAGKTVEDDELRAAMHEKGLGTPATRSSIIEGLINEKYMLREGRELIPTAKAFQLMTLLRGLGVEELSKAELTGEWEYKLAQMEHGKLSRDTFMAEIAAMTERMVKKAKEYDRDTIPGDYATLQAPCPNCGGIVKENYRRYTCTGKSGTEEGCGFSFGKTPAGRTFEVAEVEQFLRDRKIGPLDGFRSKAGWPFTAEMVIKFDDETKNYKLEFDFGDDKKAEETGELIDFAGQESLGACPKCGGAVFEHGKNYVCEKSVPTLRNRPQLRLQDRPGHPAAAGHAGADGKLLQTGKTDMLDKFVSMRTRRPFKAMLAWDAEAGKVGLRVRAVQVPAAQAGRRQDRGTAKSAPAGSARKAAAAAAKICAAQASRQEGAAKKAPAKKWPPKRPRAPPRWPRPPRPAP
jgi:DNA topoisomerase-3